MWNLNQRRNQYSSETFTPQCHHISDFDFSWEYIHALLMESVRSSKTESMLDPYFMSNIRHIHHYHS